MAELKHDFSITESGKPAGTSESAGLTVFWDDCQPETVIKAVTDRLMWLQEIRWGTYGHPEQAAAITCLLNATNNLSMLLARKLSAQTENQPSQLVSSVP